LDKNKIEEIPGIVEEIPWKAMSAKINIGCIGFKISKSGGNFRNISGDSGLEQQPLVKFEIKEISSQMELETDGKITLKLALHSIVMADIREYSPNIHRRLIAPTTKTDSEHQLELIYTILPNGDMDISVNMFAPRFVLLPDIFTELFLFSVTTAEEFRRVVEEFSQLVEHQQSPEEAQAAELVQAGPAHHLDVKIALRSPEIVVMEDTKKKSKPSRSSLIPPLPPHFPPPPLSFLPSFPPLFHLSSLLLTLLFLPFSSPSSLLLTLLFLLWLRLVHSRLGPTAFIIYMNEIALSVATNPEATYLKLGLKEFGMLRGELQGMTAEKRGSLKRNIYLLNPFYVKMAMDQDQEHTKITVKLGTREKLSNLVKILLNFTPKKYSMISNFF
jgi:hypothetical protein